MHSPAFTKGLTMRFLAISAALFLSTAACMTGGPDELSGDDPVGEEELLGDEEAEEPEVTTLEARVGGVLPFDTYFSSSTKEWALTKLQTVPGEVDSMWYTRRSNHTGRGSGQYTLSRNPTTGVRYIKFWRFDADGVRHAVDRYAYKVTSATVAQIQVRFTHEPSATSFTMATAFLD
jgi:hypothetical protein